MLVFRRGEESARRRENCIRAGIAAWFCHNKGLKPVSFLACFGTTEVVPCYKASQASSRLKSCPVTRRAQIAFSNLRLSFQSALSPNGSRPLRLDQSGGQDFGGGVNVLAGNQFCAHQRVALVSSGYQRLSSMPPTIFSSRRRGAQTDGASSVLSTNSLKLGAPWKRSLAPGLRRER